MADNHVDRPDVYAQQCVQQTGTNRPRAWYRYSASRKRPRCGGPSALCRTERTSRTCAARASLCSLLRSARPNAVPEASCGTSARCARCCVRHGRTQCSHLHRQISGGYGGRATPVPIPNTEVKPASADGTWGQFPWESRSPPEPCERTPVTSVAGVRRVRALASRSDTEPPPAPQGPQATPQRRHRPARPAAGWQSHQGR